MPASPFPSLVGEKDGKADRLTCGFPVLVMWVQLLDEPDWDIFYWCTQRKPIPERWHASFHTEGKLGHRLIAHTNNEEKAVRWMPEL